MDEFSTSMNSCISQLTVELAQVESSTGTVVTKLRMAMEKKHSLRLPSDEVQRLQVEKQRFCIEYAGGEDWVQVLCGG
eukprot:5949895-Amphidinium_carterae.1